MANEKDNCTFLTSATSSLFSKMMETDIHTILSSLTGWVNPLTGDYFIYEQATRHLKRHPEDRQKCFMTYYAPGLHQKNFNFQVAKCLAFLQFGADPNVVINSPPQTTLFFLLYEGSYHPDSLNMLFSYGLRWEIFELQLRLSESHQAYSKMQPEEFTPKALRARHHRRAYTQVAPEVYQVTPDCPAILFFKNFSEANSDFMNEIYDLARGKYQIAEEKMDILLLTTTSRQLIKDFEARRRFCTEQVGRCEMGMRDPEGLRAELEQALENDETRLLSLSILIS